MWKWGDYQKRRRIIKEKGFTFCSVFSYETSIAKTAIIDIKMKYFRCSSSFCLFSIILIRLIFLHSVFNLFFILMQYLFFINNSSLEKFASFDVFFWANFDLTVYFLPVTLGWVLSKTYFFLWEKEDAKYRLGRMNI